MALRCVLASESFDPCSSHFRWLVPDFDVEDWCSLSLPTLEAVRLLGPSLYRQALLQIVKELRPHVLLSIPPFDFLDDAISEEIRSCGTKIVAWLGEDFPETLIDRIDNINKRYDLLVSPRQTLSRHKQIRSVPWALSKAAVSVPDQDAPSVGVALIAAHTDARESLAKAIAAAGHRISCFGPGWALGALTRPSRLGVMKAAAVTIIHNDQPLLLVEGSRLGVPLIVERGPGLSAYLPSQGGPPCFSCASECIEQLSAGSLLQNWGGAPGWEEVWPRVVMGLDLAPNHYCSFKSSTLAMMLASIAHSSEHANLIHLSRAGYQALEALFPEDVDALAGLARLALAERNYAGATEMARMAIQRVCYSAIPIRNLPICVARRSPGFGLGISGSIDSLAELRSLLLTALVEDKRFSECVDEIKSWPKDEQEAVAAIFARHIKSSNAIVLSRLLADEGAMSPKD